MEYNTSSIITKYTESRGDHIYSQTINENYIILDIPKDDILRLKDVIDTLVKEFK